MFVPLNQLLLSAGAERRIADNPPLNQQQFAEQSLQLAGALQTQNIRCVALWFEDAVCLATALFACWRAGIRAILAADIKAHGCALLEPEVQLWLSDVPLLQVAEHRQWRITPDWHGAGIAALPAAVLDEQGEIIICTSGSSGTPKQVRKSWRQLQLEVNALQQQWPLSKETVDCVLGSVSAVHMYGLAFRVLWPLAAGVPFDRPQRPYPEALQHASLDYSRCIWIASPALLSRLGQRLDWHALRGRLLGLYSAGGALSLSVSDEFKAQLKLRPIEIYGSSETGVIAFRQGADHWQPFAGVELGLNEQGALHVCSPWVKEGEGQTADAVRLTAEGFELQGRLDRIVKIEGKRIALPMLEQALAGHQWVTQAHVGLVPRDNGSQRLAALLALSAEGIGVLRRQGRMALSEALRQFLAAQFEPLAVPRIWRFFEQLPLNSQGKLTKARFLEAVQQRPRLPEVEIQESTGYERLYRLKIPCDLIYFSGHFPTAPVVPGVVQIGWAMDLATRDLLPKVCPNFRFGGMEVLKFQQLIHPADELLLRLYFDREKNKLHFSFTRDDKPCSSARILPA
ncbi:AMP-binding protein [Ventosimonas gracilis]|uniref:AMP-binding protein n=1 Tax=Ventosimonas gracilis TaxID=1680762 RepID=A0A139SP47_9GAMM|nr:AMP-binding protein [Ventosimonas gracilis]KXU36292.1 AMP-binding protein [Ventosimonas gracilis]